MKHEDIFERLEPPAGGLAKLRERMRARPPLARRLAPLGAAFAVAALVLLVLFWRRSAAPDLVASARDHGGTGELVLGLAPSQGSSVALTGDPRATTALAEVPTSSGAVAFYWVSSTTGD